MTESMDDQTLPGSAVFERRSGGDRRSESERRGPTRWDPRNTERRSGEDRRKPLYLTEDWPR